LAAGVCESWALSLAPHAGPSGWTCPAQLATSKVLSAKASAASATAHAELTGAARREATLLAAASVDPVSLYLYQTSADKSSDARAASVQMRVASARGAAENALSLASGSPASVRASALAAVGATLLAELRGIVSDEFSDDSFTGSEAPSDAAKNGLEALERLLWAPPRLRPKPILTSPLVVLPVEDGAPSGGRGGGSGSKSRAAAPSLRERSASIAAGSVAALPAAAGSRPSTVSKAPPAHPSQVSSLQPHSTAVASAASGPTSGLGVGGSPSAVTRSLACAVPLGGSSLGSPVLLPDDLLTLSSTSEFFGDPWLRGLHASPTDSVPSLAALAAPQGLRPETWATAQALRARAVATLSRALAESVSAQDWSSAASAAGNLVECLGASAPVQVIESCAMCSAVTVFDVYLSFSMQAASAVALLQSVVASSELRDLLADSLHPLSRQLLNMRNISARDGSPTAAGIPARNSSAQQRLMSSLASQMLDCSFSLELTLSRLPPGTRLLILQVNCERNAAECPREFEIVCCSQNAYHRCRDLHLVTTSTPPSSCGYTLHRRQYRRLM
jgi:hypothetical protein